MEKTITYRQCNSCREFFLVGLVPKYQKYIKLRPVGYIVCLCPDCLKNDTELNSRYIKMSD